MSKQTAENKEAKAMSTPKEEYPKNQRSSKSYWEEYNSLPNGKAGDSNYFNTGPVLSKWFYFSGEQLGKREKYQKPYVHTLITINKQPDGFHICFMNDSNEKTAGVFSAANERENLATILYYQACA